MCIQTYHLNFVIFDVITDYSPNNLSIPVHCGIVRQGTERLITMLECSTCSFYKVNQWIHLWKLDVCQLSSMPVHLFTWFTCGQLQSHDWVEFPGCHSLTPTPVFLHPLVCNNYLRLNSWSQGITSQVILNKLKTREFTDHYRDLPKILDKKVAQWLTIAGENLEPPANTVIPWEPTHGRTDQGLPDKTTV